MIPINTVKYNDSVEELESKICQYTGAKHCLAVTSATAGLLMILLDCKRLISEPEIMMPSYGFPAVYKICKILGIDPVVVDMDYKSMSIDMTLARQKLTDKTVALVNIETNGVLGNLNQMESFAKENEIFFIEDSASALVQNYNGISAGRFGDVAVYSFASTKVLDSGEGGAIITDNPILYTRLADLRYNNDYSSVEPLSLNFNMSPYLAERLLSQFPSLDLIARDRERVHNLYRQHGLNIFNDPSVTNRYQYIMYRSHVAKDVSQKLSRLKIGHRYKHYTVFEDSPVANKIKSEVIDLPSFYEMSELQIKTICDLIRRIERGSI